MTQIIYSEDYNGFNCTIFEDTRVLVTHPRMEFPVIDVKRGPNNIAPTMQAYIQDMAETFRNDIDNNGEDYLC